MPSKFFSFLFIAFSTLAFNSCSDNNTNNTSGTNDSQTVSTMDTASAASIKEEAVTYTADGETMNGYIAYDESKQGKRPIVLVLPEWWGLTDYPRNRAKQLAQLGYFAMAVDTYGGGKTAANPEQAQSLATPFYKNPQLAKSRVDAALAKAKTYAQADSAQTAAIGYCYGGYVVLNAAKLGADLDAVVSFHGGLGGAPATKDLLNTKILVCHGGADSFVPQAEVDAFKKSMDSIGANYQFKVYPGATHAFTNPAADENAKKFNMPIAYNPAADTASWNDMKTFFSGIFQK
jgi:dienelactone hydrolase